ncbi:Holliday junction resolvase RuvX [Haloplasma contractile]|uniref:Putative pre-16S rRNA nuclease n=1 Tax=Haloplasma contractile SSD-17B TaxID=1033810 RepID=U2FRW9_9MOLU|nr:Holliday junction resolvase RuvX [Haloplasma contractile]ERJ13714.1 Putative Holliday junction resolvase protein [Haloplasma contractile SSD-17B]
MRALGLDLGSKTLGIAMSDALGYTAQGLETFRFNENHYVHAIDRVIELIDEHNVSKIVIGYPKNMDGSIGERAKIVERFVNKLKGKKPIDVVLWDERMTTMEAEKILIDADLSRKKRKKVIDKMAAIVILQSYLRSTY